MSGFRSTAYTRANGRILTKASDADTDPYFSSVSLLLPMEGSNGATSFIDQSNAARTVTRNGSGALTTSAGTLPYGASAYQQTTTSDNLTLASNAAFGFGAGDWTVDFWVRATNVTTRVNNIIDTRTASNTGIALFFGGGASGVLTGAVGFSSNSAVLGTSVASVVTANTWYYLRYMRIANAIWVWLGAAGGTASVVVAGVSDTRTYASASTCVIGADYAQTTTQTLTGMLKDVRVTKGVVRSSQTFDVPTRFVPTK